MSDKPNPAALVRALEDLAKRPRFRLQAGRGGISAYCEVQVGRRWRGVRTTPAATAAGAITALHYQLMAIEAEAAKGASPVLTLVGRAA